MTKSTVEKLRIAYASGKYDKLELLLSYKDIVKGQDIDPILEYKVFPDVKLELKARILEVPKAQMYYLDYQNAIRREAQLAEAAEIYGNRHYPYKERVEVIYNEFMEKLSTLKTINASEIRGFYLPDLGSEGDL